MVNDTRLYILDISSQYTYKDDSGNKTDKAFGSIHIADKEDVSEMGPRTLEAGNLGVTMAPGNIPKAANSPDADIHIVINSNLSCEGMAQIFSHEAYGHAYLYSLGGHTSWRHEVVGSDIETNEVLYNQIVNSINETIKNMEEK